MLQQNQNQFSGLTADLPAILPSGSIFVAKDTGFVYTYGANGLPTKIEGDTGWAAYGDTEYTPVSTFDIVADTKVTLPNNAGSKLETQMPRDIAEMYDSVSQTITGRNGDGLNITCEFFATPTAGGTTTIETSVDIGGAVGEIYPRLFTFPKGNGVIRPISFSISGYTLATWQANGGQIKVVANGPASIHTIRYVLTRTHKAR